MTRHIRKRALPPLSDEPAPTDPLAFHPGAGAANRGRVLRRLAGEPGTPRFVAAGLARDAAHLFRTRVHQARAGARWARFERRPAQMVVHRGLVRFLAEVDDGASIHGTHLRTLAWLVDLLEDAGIEYWTVRRDESFADIGLPTQGRAPFLAAVRASADSGAPALFVLGPEGQSVLAPARSSGDEDITGRVVGLVLPQADSTGRHTIDKAAAVRVGFWRDLGGGVRGAPEPNAWAPYLLRSSLAEPEVVDFHGVATRTLADLALPHIEHVDFPIDMVYTWVDGDDPKWRARMLARRKGADDAWTPAATSEARFRSIDELRYSLRSVFQHAPWVHHIWLVTDQQRPAWLQVDDRITVIDHRDIWADPQVLPVFNSHAIEAGLHRIPGLTEHYVYMNDDVFLCSTQRPTAFFSPGGVMRTYPSPVQIGLGVRNIREGAVTTAGKNDRAVLLAATGSAQTHRLRHTCQAQRLSVAVELESMFPEVYARTAAAPFRSPTDISPITLQSWYSFRTGRAVLADTRLRYVDLGSARALDDLDSVYPEQLDFLCLNQPREAIDERVGAAAAGFLNRTYPFRAPWEATP